MKVGELRADAQALGFTPQDQVRWLSPRQLLRTAGMVAVSSLFADYADRREVQAALLGDLVPIPPAGPDGLWLDFVADLGDGFDPTYSVAWLLGRPELELGGVSTRRGDVLVLGGDEVYPTPSTTGYEDRTTGPYRAAFSAGDAAAEQTTAELAAAGQAVPGEATGSVRAGRPVMLAVPGNHDWYDGLTAFLRVFAQRRSIGGWATGQTRSYFAAQLPGRWWLVGLDTQLGSYLDDPQLEYFRRNLSAKLQPGDAVIVCAPTPSWVRTGLGDPDAFNSMHYFEREIVQRRRHPETGESSPTGASVRVWVSGDHHHYARYEEVVAEPGGAESPGPRQLFTCGLGGAYLLGTEDLPDTLQVPPRESRMSSRGPAVPYRRSQVWPPADRSRRLRFGVLALTGRGIVARNPGLWRFVGLVHAFVLPVLAFLLGVEKGLTPADALRQGAPADVVGLAGFLGAWIAAIVALVWVLVPVARLDRPRLPPGWVAAVLMQLVVALAVLALALALPWPSGWNGWAVTGASALGAFVLAGWVGCYALAAFIVISPNREVRDWAFSAQAIEEQKGFLRMHLDPAGTLTVYPVLLEEVCHDWRLEDAEIVADGKPRRRPVPASPTALRPRLVEPPVTVVR
jgi:hypothetical protein